MRPIDREVAWCSIFTLDTFGETMRLTIHTDYALRLLMYLALKKDGLTTIAEIAATYDISMNHLMKVACELGVAGYVESVRGRGGGLRLAMPVEAIIVGDVVRKTEPDMPFVQAMKRGDRSCAVLRRTMKLATAAFLEFLDGYTLGDLIEPRVKLRALLAISQEPTATSVANPRRRAVRQTRRLTMAALARRDRDAA